MASIINASINLSKIDKSKISKAKSGDEWYNFTIIVNDEKDKYDKDVQLTNPSQKGEQKTFIGSGKTVWTK